MVTLAALSFASTHPSGHRMVHLEFGQDRLTEPQALKTFELAQRAMKLRVNVHDVHGVYNYRLAIQELGLSIDETALGNRPRAWRKAGDAAAATPGRVRE